MKKIVSLILVSLMLLSLAVPAFAANETREDAMIKTESTWKESFVKNGRTIWYTYSNPEHVTNYEFSQELTVKGVSDSEFSITYGPEGNTVTETSNGAGSMTVIIEDDDKDGNYTFAVSNISGGRSVNFTITLTPIVVEQYFYTGINLSVGDNELAYDSTAANTLYSFHPGGYEVYDDDGNIISTVEGPGTGTYKFTVKDKNGEVVEGALIGDWNNIGYPMDMTGENKTNTITWNVAEENHSFLLGIANVFEDYIITVERLGDFVDNTETIDYVDYVNVHTPVKFDMPEGNIVDVDIKVKNTLVLGTDGYYHLDTAEGPIVYVDLTTNAFNINNAFSNYGALVMRGVYTNAEGKTCGYDFLESMRAYNEAIDEDGYYPMTEDLKLFYELYGTAQAWYDSGKSSYEEIVSGDFLPESAWLVSAYYFKANDSVSNEETDSSTNESFTNDVEVKPVIKEDGNISIPVISSVDYLGATKLSYTFEYDVNKFDFLKLEGLEVNDYKIELLNNKLVLTIVNIEKVTSVKAGEKLFEIVLSPKAGVTIEELNVKVESSYDKISAKEEDKVPAQAPQTGDNMIIVVAVAVIAVVGFVAVIIIRKKTSK